MTLVADARRQLTDPGYSHRRRTLRRSDIIVILGLVAALVSVIGCSWAGTKTAAGNCASSRRRDRYQPPHCSDRPAGKMVPSGRRLEARVARDVDGDTIAVWFPGGEVDVRLLGIDTPEEVKPEYPIECGSRLAARSMSRMVVGRQVTLVTDPTQQRFDRYGRLLAYVYVDGRDVNLLEVRRGWADVYVYEGQAFKELASFRRAETEAAAEWRGVWSRCGGDFHSADESSSGS